MLIEVVLSVAIIFAVAVITNVVLTNIARQYTQHTSHPSWYVAGDDFLALDDHSRYIGLRMYADANTGGDSVAVARTATSSMSPPPIRTFEDSDIPRRLIQIKLPKRNLHNEVAAFSMREHASGRDGKAIDEYSSKVVCGVIEATDDITDGGDYEADLVAAVSECGGGVAVAPGVTPSVTSALARKRHLRLDEVMRSMQGTILVGKAGSRVVFVAAPPGALHRGDSVSSQLQPQNRGGSDLIPPIRARRQVIIMQARPDPENSDEMTLFDSRGASFAIVDYKPKR